MREISLTIRRCCKTKALTRKDVHFIFSLYSPLLKFFCFRFLLNRSGPSFVFLCSRFDYYVLQQQLNNIIAPPNVGLKKNILQFFSLFKSKRKLILRREKKTENKHTINQKRWPQQRTTIFSSLFDKGAIQPENETYVIEVQYLPDIKIQSEHKILLCATFIAIGQRIDTHSICVCEHFYIFFSFPARCSLYPPAAAAVHLLLLLLDMNRAPFGPFHLLLCGKRNGHKTNFVFTIHAIVCV